MERGAEQEEPSPAVCPDLPNYTQADGKPTSPEGTSGAGDWRPVEFLCILSELSQGSFSPAPWVPTDILRKDLNSR